MRAAYYENFGGPEAVQVGEMEIPELKKKIKILEFNSSSIPRQVRLRLDPT